MDDLAGLTAKPTSDEVSSRKDEVAVTSPALPSTPTAPASSDLPAAALKTLLDAGMDPEAFEIKSAWPSHDGEMLYSFKPRASGAASAASLTDAELHWALTAKRIERHAQKGSQEPKTALVLLGDFQIGKGLDGDGTAGTIARIESGLDNAHRAIQARIEDVGDIERIVVGFLGDHVEGFVSQGGANAWRTPMPLSEQIRVTRRIMLYAMELFNDLGLPLAMVAIPGNHGDTVRFNGKGITRYDDSHDTEALIAVADAAKVSKAYRDVGFFVPQTDDLTVVLNCSGTFVAFNHGHMSRGQNKLMEWVKGQAFNRSSPYAGVDLAVFGHYHSFDVQTDGDRMALTVPSMESESTWYKHKTGTGGDPGLLVAYTGQGRTDEIKMIR